MMLSTHTILSPEGVRFDYDGANPLTYTDRAYLTAEVKRTEWTMLFHNAPFLFVQTSHVTTQSGNGHRLPLSGFMQHWSRLDIFSLTLDCRLISWDLCSACMLRRFPVTSLTVCAVFLRCVTNVLLFMRLKLNWCASRLWDWFLISVATGFSSWEELQNYQIRTMLSAADALNDDRVTLMGDLNSSPKVDEENIDGEAPDNFDLLDKNGKKGLSLITYRLVVFVLNATPWELTVQSSTLAPRKLETIVVSKFPLISRHEMIPRSKQSGIQRIHWCREPPFACSCFKWVENLSGDSFRQLRMRSHKKTVMRVVPSSSLFLRRIHLSDAGTRPKHRTHVHAK